MPLPTAAPPIEQVVAAAAAPIEELVREAGIPLWARGGFLALWMAGALLGSWCAVHLSLSHALRPLRRDPPDAWVERARLAFRGAQVLPLASVGAPLIFAILPFLFHGPLSLLELPATMGLGFAASLVGGQLAVTRHASTLLGRAVAPGLWLRGVLWRWVLFFPGPLVAVPMCFLMPLEVSDPRSVLLPVVGALVILALTRGGALRLLRLVGVLRPATEELEALCRSAEQAAGLEPCGTGILEVPEANACAHFRPRAMLVTRPMLEVLEAEEVLAILHHEAAHLNEPGGAVTKLQVSALGTLLIPLSIPLTASLGWAVLPAVLLVLLVCIGVGQNLRRGMEVRADEAAHEHTEEGAVYARALEKLYRANLTPAVLPTSTSVHPSLYDRLVAAGVTPDYPRPELPETRGALASRLLSVPVLLVPFLLVAFAEAWADFRVRRGEGHLLETMFSGGQAWVLSDLAQLRRESGDVRGALAAARLAVAIEPEGPWWSVELGRSHLEAPAPNASPEVRAEARAAALGAFRTALEKGRAQARGPTVLEWIEHLYAHRDVEPQREEDLRLTVAMLHEERIGLTLAELGRLLDELRVGAAELEPTRRSALEQAVEASRRALGL